MVRNQVERADWSLEGPASGTMSASCLGLNTSLRSLCHSLQGKNATDYSETRGINTMRSVSEFFMVIFIAVFGALFAKELKHADVSFVGNVSGSGYGAGRLN